MTSPPPPQHPPGPPDPVDRELQLAVYARLCDRHQSHVTIMWQAPALGLTAQAFLLTISLSDTASNSARALAASLGTVVVLMSMQLMAKHRVISKRDDAAVLEIEAELGIRSPLDTLPYSDSLWGGRLSSYVIWQAGLAVFAVVNAGVLLAVAVDAAG